MLYGTKTSDCQIHYTNLEPINACQSSPYTVYTCAIDYYIQLLYI